MAVLGHMVVIHFPIILRILKADQMARMARTAILFLECPVALAWVCILGGETNAIWLDVAAIGSPLKVVSVQQTRLPE